MSVLLVGIDMTAVNVALPAIKNEFAVGTKGLAWTIDAYTLTLAALLMFSASMADRFGRKRVFMIGLTMFVIGSGLCALAPTLGWLITFRVVQALGGSALNPVAMAILSTAFPDRKDRAHAIGIWAGVTGLALAVGPIAGGAFIDSGLGWRWIFAVNIPLGALALGAAAMVFIESKDPAPRHFDPIGQILVVLLLVGMTYGIIEGGTSGWATAEVFTVFVIAATSLISIILYEPRRTDPMLELRFFSSVPFTGANVIAIAAFAILGSFLFLNSLYLQQARDFSAFHAGLLIAPLALASLIYGPINGRILARHGPRPCLTIAGIAYLAAGVTLTTVTTTTPLQWLIFSYMMIGIGNAAVGAPITHIAVAGMPPAQASLAAGVSSAARQVGATLGVAIAGVFLCTTSTTKNQVQLVAATHGGWWLITLYGAIILFLGLLVSTAWAARTEANVAANLHEPNTSIIAR